MADPISIIGAIGAMANIVDVVTKSIKAINTLRERWKEADLTLLTLASQLTALRAAMSKIKGWMDNDLQGDPHHQLVMDLDVSVKCCELLMSKVDDLLGELGDDVDEPLDFSSIVKLVFKGKSIEDLQKLIEQQTSALTLLLTACNCETLSEQKLLLEKSKTRKILGRAQVDSASLFVHRDSASLISTFTDTLSRLSLVFDFDPELFTSKIYQQVLRGSVKETLRRKQDNQASERSKAIDKRIEQDRKSLSVHCEVLVFGTEESVKARVIKKVKIYNEGGFTIEERLRYKPLIEKDIIRGARMVIEAFETFDLQAKHGVTRDHFGFLSEYLGNANAEKALTAEVAEAIGSLWRHLFNAPLLDADLLDTISSMKSTSRLLDDIQRISAAHYVPTESDIIAAPSLDPQTCISTSSMSFKKLSFVNVVGEFSAVKKYLHNFDGVLAIMFVVDLANYDKTEYDGSYPPVTRLAASMAFFEQLVNSKWFICTGVLLVFANVASFERRLIFSPLRNLFPEYTGGCEVEDALSYIFDRFLLLKHSRTGLYMSIEDRPALKPSMSNQPEVGRMVQIGLADARILRLGRGLMS